MTEFPDRNLDHLHARVASGRVQRTYLDGVTPKTINAQDVSWLPVGTVLLDEMPHDPSQFGVWVRVDTAQGPQVICLVTTFEHGEPGHQMPANELVNTVVIGAVPGTLAASA